MLQNQCLGILDVSIVALNMQRCSQKTHRKKKDKDEKYSRIPEMH